VVTSSINNQHKKEKVREGDGRKEKAMDRYPYKLYCKTEVAEVNMETEGFYIARRFRFSDNNPTFKFIVKTSFSLQYRFFQMIFRRQLKLMESRCDRSVCRL
jgi:hypothetical protein